jgi:hypothetical protein
LGFLQECLHGICPVENCWNQQIQQGIRHQVEITNVGLCASVTLKSIHLPSTISPTTLPENEFIMEFVGEVITLSQFQEEPRCVVLQV